MVDDVPLRDAVVHLPHRTSVTAPIPGQGFGAAAPAGLAVARYLETEHLLSTLASVYDDASGTVTSVAQGVRATTRVLVRRPECPEAFSGVVFVELMDMTDGYDVADLWSACQEWIVDEGHAWVGITASPVAADALAHWDAQRYAQLNWRRDPAIPAATVRADDENYTAAAVLDGAEEGLVWDLLAATVLALREGEMLTAPAATVLVGGHSSGGVQVNTFANTLHTPYSEELGRPLVDGYLNVGGGGIRRTLRQDSTMAGVAAWRPARPPQLTVPHITVSSEADHVLFGSALLAERTDLGPLVRHVQVPGAPHRDLTDPARPGPDDVARAGRRAPRGDGHRSCVPLAPVVEAMAGALTCWAISGVEAPPSRWLQLDATGALMRDELGNALGGVRTALANMPCAAFTGASADHLQGHTELISPAAFAEHYGTREDFLAWFDIIDGVSITEGYLTELGHRRQRDVAIALLDGIGAN